MLIRSATPTDAAAIAHVHVEAQRTAYKNLLSDDYLAGISVESRTAGWLEILSHDAIHAFTFVAETDGKIVGFINGGAERTNDPNFVAEIYAIYLLESHRHQGIGTALFLEAVQSFKSNQLDSMKVSVLSDNQYRRFYERNGGCVVGEKPIAIGGKELMATAYGWKSLKGFRQPPTIRRVRSEDHAEWLRMRQSLWPDDPVQELADDIQVWLQEQDCVALVAERQNGGLCGFLEVAIRPCNAGGAIGRFGYIEGLYVDPHVRRLGIGRSLVEAAEAWVLRQGCDELLSDARIENTVSQNVHQLLGFTVVKRLAHFQKQLRKE